MMSTQPCQALFSIVVVIENKVDDFHGADGGNGMFVYKLLFAIRIENNGEIVEALYQTFQLKSVRQVDGHGNVLFPDLI